MSKVYVIATAHDVYRQHEFPPGSVVIDPWRMIPDRRGVTVNRIGQHRPALISVLIPSRGRPESFSRMLDSLYNTVTYADRVEVVCWLDDDDASLSAYWRLSEWPVNYLNGPRQLLSQCWNDCAAEAKGEILMHCGDDVTFNTPGWDVMVREEFAKIPDRIGLVFGDDLSTNFPELATHGFLHRRWVETVGYFLPPLFSSDWNDVWISEVATKIGRMFPLPDMVIEHHHYTFGKAERDQTHHEREERGVKDKVVELFQRTAKEREADTLKLKAVMT